LRHRHLLNFPAGWRPRLEVAPPFIQRNLESVIPCPHDIGLVLRDVEAFCRIEPHDLAVFHSDDRRPSAKDILHFPTNADPNAMLARIRHFLDPNGFPPPKCRQALAQDFALYSIAEIPSYTPQFAEISWSSRAGNCLRALKMRPTTPSSKVRYVLSLLGRNNPFTTKPTNPMAEAAVLPVTIIKTESDRLNPSTLKPDNIKKPAHAIE
jgi:hypothetical protein